jgi:hypothetical protein
MFFVHILGAILRAPRNLPRASRRDFCRAGASPSHLLDLFAHILHLF